MPHSVYSLTGLGPILGSYVVRVHTSASCTRTSVKYRVAYLVRVPVQKIALFSNSEVTSNFSEILYGVPLVHLDLVICILVKKSIV